jgi:AraC-like DNA-binding protein
MRSTMAGTQSAPSTVHVRGLVGRSAEPQRDRRRPEPVRGGEALDEVNLEAPGALALRNLASRIARHAPHDGVFPLRLPGTYALRVGRVTTEPVHATLGASLCLVAQGAKAMMLGSDVLDYDAARMLVFAVDLPVAGQVTRASQREPYLGFKLDLQPARIADLAARVFPRGVPRHAEQSGLYIGRATDDIVEAATRLLDLMGQPQEADLLGPLVIDEILIRLLRTSIGPRVAQIGEPKSGVHRIARAIAWIREHVAQPVTVEDMAAAVDMHASSFHQRFKAVTTMSPLQYQKALRLQEARRLMLFQDLDATQACHRVGYLSPSQFSREYARFFGNSPTKDIARLRGDALGIRRS